jgi:SAM-dependent methyltransferase
MVHITAALSADAFLKIYGAPGKVVLEVGGRDIGGSNKGTLQGAVENAGMKYICLDMEAHPSVTVVCQPGDPFPLADGSVDLVISTSCFEHDSCFWMTFREMSRVTKKGGFMYVNAPANGPYHGYPGDCWRFYGDAAQALAHWSGRLLEGKQFPTAVVESFHILPYKDVWIDFVGIWTRVDEPTQVAFDKERRSKLGVLAGYLRQFHQLEILMMN